MMQPKEWNTSYAEARPIPGNMTDFIEGQIERRSSGQIRDLHVVFRDGQLILQGRTRTYHAKQLAQQAVLEFGHSALILANHIEVY